MLICVYCASQADTRSFDEFDPLAVSALVLASAPFVAIKSDPICIFNGNIIGSVETRTIGGKMYLSASELARDTGGSVKFRDGDTLMIDISMSVAHPSIPATQGAWMKDKVTAWAKRVEAWGDRTDTLLSLIDATQVTSEDEQAAKLYLTNLKNLRGVVRIIRMRASEVTTRPLTVISMCEKLSLLPMEDIERSNLGVKIKAPQAPN